MISNPAVTTDVDRRLARVELRLQALARRLPNGRRVLITGGTGTLGQHLTGFFLRDGYEVTVLSRDGHKQALYRERFPEVACVLADIRDYDAVLNACLGQDIVIHAAAQKRVDIGELEINEFASVNIDGTRTVAQACDTAGVGKALFISSDKAIQPLNWYGVTKAAGERLWCQHNYAKGCAPTRFSAVRYGNVMGSNGSVLQVWRQQLAAGQAITVRSPETTRFFMTPADAVDLVLDALFVMQGGEIFVPTCTPAFALYDLAEQLAPRENWQMLPLGPREKLHELLIAPGECWEAVSEDIVRVWPNRPAASYDVPEQFCSRTAPRLPGAQVMTLLGG